MTYHFGSDYLTLGVQGTARTRVQDRIHRPSDVFTLYRVTGVSCTASQYSVPAPPESYRWIRAVPVSDATNVTPNSSQSLLEGVRGPSSTEFPPVVSCTQSMTPADVEAADRTRAVMRYFCPGTRPLTS